MSTESATNATPQDNTGTGGGTSQTTETRAPETTAQGVTTDTSQSTEAAPPATGDAKAPEGPKADVQSAAEYGLDGKDELTKGFTETAYAQGMTKAQVQAVAAFWAERSAQETATAVREAENSANLLKKEWQGEYTGNMAMVNKGIDTFATPALVKKLESSGFGRDPDMVKLVYSFTKLLSEDSYVTGGNGGGSSGGTAANKLYPDQP